MNCIFVQQTKRQVFWIEIVIQLVEHFLAWASLVVKFNNLFWCPIFIVGNNEKVLVGIASNGIQLPAFIFLTIDDSTMSMSAKLIVETTGLIGLQINCNGFINLTVLHLECLLIGVIWKFSPNWRGKPKAEVKPEALAGEDFERKIDCCYFHVYVTRKRAHFAGYRPDTAHPSLLFWESIKKNWYGVGTSHTGVFLLLVASLLKKILKKCPLLFYVVIRRK